VRNNIAGTVLNSIEEILKKQDFVLVAIDGRCGSGKTTLAAQLKELGDYEIIQMDHFYPRLSQRTPQRLSEPGGNLDRERILEEVMKPLGRREKFEYRPYDPVSHSFADPVEINPGRAVVLEGSYSCHPDLFDYYDLRVFMTVGMPERLRRIRARNGEEGLEQFKKLWIPKEELYFETFGIENRCDLCFET